MPMRPRSPEADLWDLWRSRRDADAFAEIVSRHSAMVHAVCRRILKNPVDAEDVAQECFLELAGNGPRVRSSLAPWLHRRALYRSLDFLKSKARRDAREEGAATSIEREEIDGRETLLRSLDGAIASLPSGLRSTVVLRFLEGKTHREISREIGVSESAVRYRIERGVERIRKRLAVDGESLSGESLSVALASLFSDSVPPKLTESLGKIALAGIETSPKTGARGWRSFGGGSSTLGWGLGVSSAAIVILLAVFLARSEWTGSGGTHPVFSSSPSSDSEAVPGGLGEPPLQESLPEGSLAAESVLKPSDSESEGRGLGSASSIRLQVIGANGKALAGARVRTFEDSVEFEGLADEKGICSLPIAPSGESMRLWVDAEDHFHLRIWVARLEELSLRLYPATTLFGTVRDADSSGEIPRACLGMVHLFCQGCEAVEVVADDRGKFEFPGVPVGAKVYFSVGAQGYPHASESFTLAEPASRRTRQDFSLRHGYLVGGVVTDCETKRELSGVEVRSSRDALAEVVTTDARGEFALRGLPSRYDGVLKLDFRKEGYCRVTAMFFPEDLVDWERASIPLPRSTILEGVVFDSQSRGVEGVRIRVWNESRGSRERPAIIPELWDVRQEEDHLSATTDASGSFRLASGLLPWGNYTLAASHPDFVEARLDSIEPQLGLPSVSVEVRITSTEEAGTISGRVLLNGEPTAGTVSWAGSSRRGVGAVDVEGRYWLTGVEPGRVRVEVVPLLYRDQPRVEIPGQERFVDSLAGGEVACDFDLRLARGSLAGELVFADGSSAPRRLVEVRCREHFFSEAVWSDREGRFSLEVPDQGCDFQIGSRIGPEFYTVEGVRVGGPPTRLEIPQLGFLSLRVTDARTDEPLEFFEVWVRPLGEEDYSSAGSRRRSSGTPEGRFELELPTGGADLVLRSDVYGYRPAFLENVEVAPGKDAAPRVVKMKRGVLVELHLDPAGGEFPSDHHLYLLDEEDWEKARWSSNDGLTLATDEPAVTGWLDISRSIRFSDEGKAWVQGLPFGSVRFKVFPDDLVMVPSRLDLAEGQGRVIELGWTRK